ncbi:MAG: NAD(P)(+) transhydrogenase (Re/Si-specific) subunit beta [Candidatus Scalindua sp.]|jgi:NAD(P) transhydrogenase subunit beta|nr:NAD(P)(+) transhydrogenase (Re/Si-specific) subunit beta [Candidatus Scalindua sp.]MBT5305696.1 NAD(P)(+) transhydrogenase (Re/Si-specific) subunit beta [Candidatus Scalindua sp.]MBT6231053.1 NAD(P)(+) transhydrogenase (Re/Si-specific) subunit beta [Candidatus Scalindua sp.]MBT6561040.1 NAD(P)(+) transhydrogenase (Re/Si-specific) subunit beta [Candidatus Scalindua sp.]MBT7211451.1 NAD(P)(+) transhydrogenase (Re/Si-specific) subunit beta [Candidatus Scalindua sp.]
MNIIIALAYLLSSILFILGLKNLGSPKTARRGNQLAMTAMLIAIIVTLTKNEILDFTLIIIGLIIGSAIGAIIARKVQMTAVPQMVALFNGLGGGASALVALAEYNRFSGDLRIDVIISMVVSLFIGTVTFTGSLVAFGKLQGLIRSAPVVFKAQRFLNILLFTLFLIMGIIVIINPANSTGLLIILAIALILGILFVMPIGGADMPVVISTLNSCSGLAAAATGFVLSNNILIICGALVGASGFILTRIMCKAMNRSLVNIIFGPVGTVSVNNNNNDKRKVINYTEEDASIMLEAAKKVIIVPGYGLAVAQAQFALQELVTMLINKGIHVRYAIHPVAGRMPGHMNVLLAEANVSYDLLFDLNGINGEFKNTDVALIVGANDVINPSARTNKESPLYGMPILNADQAKTVVICKRSLSPGFSGVDNELFYQENTLMIFGDAKESINKMIQLLKT